MPYRLKVRRKIVNVHYPVGDPDVEHIYAHTHEWIVEVALEYRELLDPEQGVAMSFAKIEKTVDEVLPDHQNLNVLYDFPPTVENLSRHWHRELLKQGLPIASVTVWDSPRCAAEWVPSESYRGIWG